MLEIQSSQLQDHQHDDPGHSHGCSANSKSGNHNHTYKRGKAVREGRCNSCSIPYTVTDADKNPNSAVYEDIQTDSVSVSVSTTCILDTEGSNLGGVDSNSAESGQETRPANMKVIYIIRVN